MRFYCLDFGGSLIKSLVSSSVGIVFAMLGNVCFAAVEAQLPDKNATQISSTTVLPSVNPWLAKSAYPISHHNAAQTDVTLVDGPRISKQLTHDDARYVPLLWCSAPTYKHVKGGTVVIASNPLGIMKIRATGEDFSMISNVAYPGREDVHAEVSDDDILKVMRDIDEKRHNKQDILLLLNSWWMYWKLNINMRTMPSGAYAIIDKDGYHYAAYDKYHLVKSFDNNDVDAPLLPVKSANIVEQLPDDVADSVEKILGLTMTYDGHLVAAANGVVMIADRELNLKDYVAFPAEHVENSVAVDADNGIFVVTSKAMHKLNWNGESLAHGDQPGAWTSAYDVMAEGEAQAMGAASHGSGTTPALLGFGDDEDKLVIISDGSPDGAQIVAFWRDEIPTEFEQRAGTKSRRIADQIRLSISDTTIEACPVVYGNGILVVNSTYPEPGPISMDLISNAFLAGTTRKAPRGIQKYEWNSDTRKLEESWSMPDVDNTDWMPPAVSAANGLVYIANKRNDVYEYFAADWITGEVKAVWPFPDNSVLWNTWGGITVFLEDGDFLLGGFFALKRFNTGGLR
ncbi:MAG: hypothetical protein AAF542_11315 [Pseudomonadota bacterium]